MGKTTRTLQSDFFNIYASNTTGMGEAQLVARQLLVGALGPEDFWRMPPLDADGPMPRRRCTRPVPCWHDVRARRGWGVTYVRACLQFSSSTYSARPRAGKPGRRAEQYRLVLTVTGDPSLFPGHEKLCLKIMFAL